MNTFRADIVANRSFNSLLEICIRSRPGAEFLATPEGQKLTYAEFGTLRDNAATALTQRGIRRGDRVLLAIPTSLRQVGLMFGLYRIGAVAVMCNPAWSPREVLSLARRTEAKLLVLESEMAARFSDSADATDAPIISRAGPDFEALFDARQVGGPWAQLGAGDQATIVATSGTTAEPKIVVYAHGHHVFAGEAFRRNLSMTQDDLLMHHFPLFHMSGLGQLAAAVTAGARILLLERFRSSLFESMVETFEPTITFLNSTHVKMVREASGDRPPSRSSLRFIIFALAMADEHYDWFEKRYGDILRGAFGMTETVTGAVMNPLVGAKRESCGLPVPGYEIRVVREDGTDASVDEPGELCITCYSEYGMVSGYVNDPTATVEAFVDGWLHTGDMVRRDADGFVFWIQRYKDVIKRAGENISPQEVEAVFAGFPGVSDVVVVGRPDPLREELPVAVVIADEGATIDVSGLLAHARAELAAFKVPIEVRVVKSFPRNAVGKIVRRELLAALDAEDARTGSS